MGWLTTMGACEINAQGKFHAVGAACARRPWLAIALNFLITVICGLGFANIVLETKGDRLVSCAPCASHLFLSQYGSRSVS